MKRAIICGAAGFLGSNLTRRLKQEGYYVRGFDIKKPEFEPFQGDDFYMLDLKYLRDYDPLFTGEFDGGPPDEVYQLACNMGGMGFLGDATNDAVVLRDNALINLHVLEACARLNNKTKVFFSSSACVYPELLTYTQRPNGFTENTWAYKESDAYPAHPDLEYGYEKLFSERVYASYGRRNLIQPRVARLHNVFGPLGAWKGGREKAPAAICRKVAEAKAGDAIEIWGTGNQRRSFLFIDEALEGIRRLMNSEFEGPVNLGSNEAVTINQLVDFVCDIAGKNLTKKYVKGPIGVNGRNSDNTLIVQKLKWKPTQMLRYGLERTYQWVEQQVQKELTPTA